MKYGIISIYVFIFSCLLGILYTCDTRYNMVLNQVNDKLNDISYKEEIIRLENEYSNLINNLEQLSDISITENDDIKLLNDSLDKKYQELIIKNEELNSTKSTLTNQYNVLVNQYNVLKEEERKRSTFLINGVSKINQYSIGYPTGCESVALTILLNYWGVNVSVSDVVKYLPLGSKPYWENGIKYGGNPYLEFIGNPSDKYSYGVYDIPIENVANNFKDGIINGRGKSFSEILEIVRQNRPVIVWGSMNLGIPHYTNSWIYKTTGEKINWLADLHAIVVIGYTKDQVITTDSLTGTYRYFNKSIFESRYNAFGKRALYY